MKVLIIRPAALGDTLMLMPAIAHLAASTEIVLVGRSPGLNYLRPYTSVCIDYERSGWHRLFLENPDGDHAFSLPKVDCVVAFLSAPDESVSKNLKSYLPKASVNFFPAFPPEEAQVHVAYYLAQCLKRAGLPIDPKKCIEAALRRPLLDREGEAIRQGKMVFQPGSGGKSKNYPPDFWLELIKASRKSLFSEKKRLVILLGPAEEQLRPFFTKNLHIKGAEILFSPEKETLMNLVKRAPLYMGHDSGITHLAAMLGTPVIALFKNTLAQQWRPLGPAVKVFESEESPPSLIPRILKEATALIKSKSNSY